MRSLVAARDEGGPFKDLFDLAERVDVRQINRKQLEGLAMAGAFDSLNRNRAQVIAAIDLMLKHSHAAADERESGQTSIFGGLLPSAAKPALPKTKVWDELTRLNQEFQALGFYLSAHPLDNYGGLLDRLGVVKAGAVTGMQRALGPSRYKLAGIILGRQERTARSGNKFAFVQVSDTAGAFEVTVFSELLAARRDIMEPGQAVLIEVDAQSDERQGGANGGGDMRFIARSIEPLKNIAAKNGHGIRIKLYDEEAVVDVQKHLAEASKGRGKVKLLLDLDEETVEVELPGAWQLSEGLKTSLRQIGNGLEVEEC